MAAHSDNRFIFGAVHGGDPSSNPAGAGVSVGTNGIVVAAHKGSYMPPLAVYQGTISGWHHVAVVFNNKVPTIYLDGNPVALGVAANYNVFPSNQIGGGAYGNFYGTLDDVRIIGSALTTEQIKWEYYNNKNCSDL